MHFRNNRCWSAFRKVGRSKFLGSNYKIANLNHYINYCFIPLWYFMLEKQRNCQSQKFLQISTLWRVAKRSMFVLKCCEFCSNLCAYHTCQISLCWLNYKSIKETTSNVKSTKIIPKKSVFTKYFYLRNYTREFKSSRTL